MDATAFLTAFTTLFVMIDPIGLAPIFVALTPGMNRTARLQIGLRAVAVATALMAVFGFTGMKLLEYIGITLPAFRIAGGLLLFLIAAEMLFEKRTQRREGRSDDAGNDPSVFPLALPLIAGPGALTTMVLLTSQGGGGWGPLIVAEAAMAAVMVIVTGFFAVAPAIERLLGHTGVLVVTRVLAILLAALSVQFVLDGLKAVGLGHG